MSRGISIGSTWLEIAESIAIGMNSPYKTALNSAIRIARTEGHRIQNQSKLDAAQTAADNGADVVKQWDATLDGRTRPEHRQADGQIRELDEYFDVGGEKMKAPGVGGSARNVCNCRCCMLQRARWALDEDELKTLQERAAYFGLDKTDSFTEFKEKYLNATAESEESESGTSGKKVQKTKNNTVNLDYISSKEYHEKFKGITGNNIVDEQIYSQSKAMLIHRSSTDKENLCLIDSRTGKIVGSQSSSRKNYIVEYNNSLSNAIKSSPRNTLISIHNHPTNNPPTGSDFVSAGSKGYKMGIVVTHDGKVFSYKAGSNPFTAEMFGKRVDRYKDKGYNEYEAIIETLREFEHSFGISWEEYK